MTVFQHLFKLDLIRSHHEKFNLKLPDEEIAAVFHKSNFDMCFDPNVKVFLNQMTKRKFTLENRKITEEKNLFENEEEKESPNKFQFETTDLLQEEESGGEKEEVKGEVGSGYFL